MLDIYHFYIFVFLQSDVYIFISLHLYLQKNAHRIINIASCISYLQGAIIRSRVLLYASSTQGMELDT